MPVKLTESMFSQAAGWEVMKRARACLAQGQVLSSHWSDPLLRGVVQIGQVSFRASLVIRDAGDMENLCTCREAREWGKICPHVVGVGLHWLLANAPPVPVPAQPSRAAGIGVASKLRAPRTLRRDPEGEKLELFVILPPNLPEAVARGKVMLVIEAQRPAGRCPLNAVPLDRGYALSTGDEAFLDRLESLADGQAPGMLLITVRDFAGLLPALTDHPNITLGKTVAVQVTQTVPELPWRIWLEPNGEILVSLNPTGPVQGLLPGWVFRNNAFQRLDLPPLLAGVFQAPVRISRAQVPFFLSQAWPQLAGAEANFKLQDFVLTPQEPRFALDLKGGLAQLTATIQCAYGARIMTLGVTRADEAVWLPDPSSPTRYSTRNLAAEQAAVARLQRHGFAGPDAQGKLCLNGQNAVLNFFAREYPRLQRDWAVSLEERLDRSARQNIERVEPRFEVRSSGVQWFDLGVVFATASGETFSQAEIQRLLLSGQSHTRLRNGRFAVIDTGAVEELQEVLRDCSPEQHGGGYRLNAAQAGFLDATLRGQQQWKVDAPPVWRQRAAGQNGEVPLECPPLGPLDTILRPYQKHGVAWLRFLRANQFGGILADEMGLGKTIQTLAFIQSVRAGAAPGPGLPVLVVCPTSLVFNWAAEAARFTPSLKVLALHGPERHSDFARIPGHDLVITSYALIRHDVDRYRGLEFDTVVLDEAQHIKNRQTQNAQAVKAIRSTQRLVLTGTPLENSVLDLWSIFDFLMPGYLGTAQDFRDRYEAPITREKDPRVQARLARRLRPFLLRRLKREVASDLPERLEQVAYCELTEEQRGVYQQVIEASRKEVLEAVGTQGLARSRMVVLSALLRLRQVCCDLRLLKVDGLVPANPSGKLDLFGELLEEVLDGGHRVLVFSQFVSMLQLLRERLDAEGIEYCYLDGSTTDRAGVVARFQSGDQVPVFLISLKAGGVGLNLTGADTVIHFDPWWNPAVEAQATDRAHRIGQTRVVTSYKLITRDTVEEKILALQNRKRELIAATIAGEEQFAEALTWEDVQELLA